MRRVSENGTKSSVLCVFCACLLLLSACRDRAQPWMFRSTPSTAKIGPGNEEYIFFVSAQRLKNSFVLGSPILIWPRDVPPPRVGVVFVFEEGRYHLAWEESQTREDRRGAVLFYKGSGQMLRELAPKWDSHLLDSPEALRKHVEALLVQARNGDTSP